MIGSPPTNDIGHLDTLYGPWVSDWQELIPDLIFPTSVQTYARMRHDPQLTAVLSAYTLPIRRATWVIDPAGCRDEVVRLVSEDLGLPVLGATTGPTPARRSGVRWDDHLRLALLSLVYGFMPFEQRYEIRNGQARLVALGERMPHTIGDIKLKQGGVVESISQDLIGTRPIPASRLVWYVHDREGANWAGRSMLRPAFGPWLLKHEMWRVHATSIRRFGMGIPSVEAPAGGTPAQVAEAQRLASAMRAGDTAGVGLPAGFKLAVTGMTGSVPDAMAFISYLDQQMSRSALAGILDLGETRNGSRALGQTMLEMFLLSLQAIADEIADTATSGQPGMPGIVTSLVDFNWGENEPAPRIVCTDVGDRHEVTAEALDQLLTSGAISPDPELEAYVRTAWGLPARAARPSPPVEQPQARRVRHLARARPHAAASEGQRRPLTAAEQAAGTDFTAVQEAWQAALDALLEAWEQISAEWRETLGDQIAAAIEAGDLQALAAMSLDSQDATDVLTVGMLELAEQSAAQVADEAAVQGVEVEPPPVDEGLLGAVAATVAALLAVWLAGAAAREALRLAVPGSTGRQVADGVTAHLEGLSDAFLREQFGAVLSTAQASGRFAVLDAAPKAEYAASEVLDQATCKACKDIDGTVFDDLDHAKATYANGGYIDCEGRLRCRGIVIALWNGEA
ncbi:DUF935 family protein [Nonomuraea sp. NPDC050310]|uniref:phage portal protein family protein n=1 Tax=Nonomuraea sp. NPDC050310 TaxID=3154935 RepID=UPI0033E3F700